VTANDLWFTARGAGLSALLALSIATACGALGSLPTAAATTRVVVQYLHRTAAVLGIGLIVVHVSTIVLDSKAHIGVAGALVPFAASYRPTAVALGSTTAYLLLLVAALGLARGRLAAAPAGARAWRAAHSLGYLLWAAAVLHGLLAGTDRGQGWVVLLVIGCVLLVLAAGTVRLLGLDDASSAARPPNASSAGRPTNASPSTDRTIGTVRRPVSRQPRNVLR
jgi:predicted ferric reductase